MAVEKFPDEISSIRALLSENPEGLTIRSISAMLGMNRNSAAKYLGMLQMQGSVTLKRDGSSKVYCLANRLPAAAVLKLTKSHVIIFDQSLSAADINDSLRDFLSLSKEEIIGKTIDLLPLTVQSHPILPALILEGIQGKESRRPAVIKSGTGFIPCSVSVNPVYFDNGDNGVAVIIDLLQDPKNPDNPGSGTGNGLNYSFIDLDEREYICQFGPDRTLTYVNSAYCEMMQKTRDELIGHTWQPVIIEKEQKKIQKNLDTLDAKNPVLSSEFRMITPGGESRWQQWKFRAIFNDTGQVIQYQGIGLDISHQKNLEEQLRAKEQELEKYIRDHKNEVLELNRQIYTEISAHEKKDFQLQFTQFSMDNASYMIIWTNKEGQFVYMNKKAQEILGYPRRQLLTKKIGDLLSPATPFSWEEVWIHIEQNRHFTIETLFQTRDQGGIPVEIFFNYLEFKEKQYCCCFAKDITERKQIEEAKRESERRFRVIFHSTFEFIGLLQPDGTVLEVNETALRYVGLALSDVIGKPFWETYWWSISAQTKVQLRNAIVRAAGGMSIQYVVDIFGEGGKVATIDFSLKPVTDDTGAVTSLIAEGRDISERMQYVSRLAVSERRYHSLFETMLEGYAYGKIIYDNDLPKDFVYIEVNSAFEKLTGLSDVVGKKVSEVNPAIHKSNPELLQTYGRVALTGQTERFETYIPSLDYYLSITVYSKEGGYFTAVFDNITERRRAKEALLKKSEELLASNERLTSQDEELRQMIDNLSQSEQALRESGQKYRTLVENSGTGIIIIDRQGTYLLVNKRAADLMGVPQDEIIGKTLFDFLPEDTAKKYLARNLKILDSGIRQEYEDTFDLKNGKRTFLIIDQCLKDPAGKSIALQSSSVEITDRKRAEEALHLQSEMVQNMAEGVVLVRVSDGIIVYANPRFENMFGYDPGELVGRHISMVNASGVKSPRAMADEIISYLKKTGVWSGELPNLRKDGTTFWCHATISTFDHPQYGPVWVSVHLDITAQKHAEEELRHREHDFSTLVENASDMIVRFDRQLRYIYCNPAVERQLGIPVHLLLGKTSLEFGTSVREGRFIFESLQRTLESGKESNVEQTMPTPHGARHFLTRIVPERDTGGSIVSLLAITRDITERKRAEEVMLEKSHQDLKASHDILQVTEADLNLHKTELEAQNEELRIAQARLETSRERYFELYDLAPAGYFTLSEKGLILNANLTAATLLGVERQELIKKPVSRYILPDDQDIFYRCRIEFIETRERQWCELRMLHADGSSFRVQIIAVPAPAVEGDEAAISLMVIESSGRRQTDMALKERIEIFPAIFEHHDAVMLLIEPDTGKIIDANRAAERFYGRSKNKLCSQSIDDINTLPPDEIAALRAKVARGGFPHFTSQHRLEGGEIRSVEVHSSPIAIGGKTVLFSIIHDASGREKDRRDTAASRAKDHDLK